MSVVHQGLADLLFSWGDQELSVPGIQVTLVETMPQIFQLAFVPEQPGSETAEFVQVLLPGGRIEAGRVSYSRPGSLVFTTRGGPTHA